MGMDCNSCPKTDETAAPVITNAQVLQAAQKLACLLAETEIFQNFVQRSRSVRLDEQVENLASMINEYPGYDASGANLSSIDDLQAQIEALPVVVEYRKAEQAAFALFGAVNAAVSQTAGVNFAEQAKPAACG